MGLPSLRACTLMTPSVSTTATVTLYPFSPQLRMASLTASIDMASGSDDSMLIVSACADASGVSIDRLNAPATALNMAFILIILTYGLKGNHQGRSITLQRRVFLSAGFY